MRCLDDGGNVLVGARRLLGVAAPRWALDDEAALAEFVYERPSMPLLQGLVATQVSPGTVTRGGEGVLRAQRGTDHDCGSGSHTSISRTSSTCGPFWPCPTLTRNALAP